MRGVVGDVAEEAERVFNDVSEGGSRVRAEIWRVDRQGRDVRYFGSMFGVCLYVCTQYVSRDAGNPVCCGGLWQEWAGLCAGARLCL